MNYFFFFHHLRNLKMLIWLIMFNEIHYFSSMRLRFALPIFLIWLLFTTTIAEGQGLPVKVSTGADSNCVLMEYHEERYIFRAGIDHILLTSARKPEGYTGISVPGCYLTGNEGGPALPQGSRLFEAGPQQIPAITITGLDSVIYDLNILGFNERLSPFKLSARKGESPEGSYADPTVYRQDQWLGEPVVTVNYEGIMRGLPFSRLVFNPVLYNPAKNLLKIYYNIECSISLHGIPDRKNIPSEAFSAIFERVTKTDAISGKKAIFTEEPMTMVILSDTVFRETLQPFIDWKSRKGFRVIEAYRQDPLVGTTRESIKSYLSELYFNPSPGFAPTTYLLIVGDVQYIPLSQPSGEITDLYYSEYDGEGDYIPDIFYGRISVDHPDQLEAVLDKILRYEQYLFDDPSFMDEALLIAGMDGDFASKYGNGQINYANQYYFNEQNGFNAHTFLYPESGSGRGEIIDYISAGVGFVNYTGHGESDRWTDPLFLKSDIEILQNGDKYPVMIGNGCETNRFSQEECLAEALLRAQGKGALAYIGCTNDSYWDEDYYWSVGAGTVSSNPLFEETESGYYDKVFHTHAEAFDIWTPSLGEMVFGGNMAVQQSNSSRKKFYWEIYQLAGDPTLVPWFPQPGVRDVIHPDIIPPDATRIDISCSPFDYVAVSRNGELLDSKHSSEDGFVTLNLPLPVTVGKLDLLVTGSRYRPYSREILVDNPAGVYLDLLDYSLALESVEEDQIISIDEYFSLNLQLINRGEREIIDDTLVIFSCQDDLEVTDSIIFIDLLAPGDTANLSGAFRIRSLPLSADQTRVDLGFYRNSRKDEHQIYISERIHAPVLKSVGILWEDLTLGNGDGIVDPGEWLDCSWIITNTGHFRTGRLWGVEQSTDSCLIGEVSFDTVPSLNPGDSVIIPFRARICDGAGGLYRTAAFLCNDSSVRVIDSIFLSPGRYMEDFSLAEVDRFPFANNSQKPWKADGSSHMSSPFSFRSGTIENSESSELSIRFNSVYHDTLSFSVRISSEPGYDYLWFYVDSVPVQSWSGENDWSRFDYILKPGTHTATWIYVKDKYYSRGADAAWIDDIVFPESAFRQFDLSLSKIVAPVSGPWLKEDEEARIQVSNSGMDTIHEFTANISMDDNIHYTDRVIYSLPPWQTMEYSFKEAFDLSGLGRYDFSVWISCEADNYSDNDTVNRSVDHYGYPDISLILKGLDEIEGVYIDAIVSVENQGNIFMDSLLFEIIINDSIRENGSEGVNLGPGELTLAKFRLIDSTGTEHPSGNYSYIIRSVTADSVFSNNQVSGIFSWRSLNSDPSYMAGGFLIYPNPAVDGFYILMAFPAVSDFELSVLNGIGVIQETHTVEKGAERIFIPARLPPGYYIVKLDDTGFALPLVISD